MTKSDFFGSLFLNSCILKIASDLHACFGVLLASLAIILLDRDIYGSFVNYQTKKTDKKSDLNS